MLEMFDFLSLKNVNINLRHLPGGPGYPLVPGSPGGPVVGLPLPG